MSLSDCSDCTLSCEDVCAGQGGDTEPLDLCEVQQRFQREATADVCDTSRYKMPFFSWGNGPPLLFIHGLGDTSMGFLLPIARLSAHFRCIAYQMPVGRGDGAKLRRYTHDHLVDDILALVDHLGLSRCYLLGSSFGTTVLLKALRAAPERFPRAILQGGIVHRPLRRAERWLSWWGRYLPGRTRHVPLREKLLRAVNGKAFTAPTDPRFRYYLDCTGEVPLDVFAYQARWLHGLDLRPMLPEVGQPILLFCGEEDRVAGPRHEQMLLDGLPNAGRVRIPGCGHVPSYSHPEVLAEVVRVFLTPASPPPSARTSSSRVIALD